jgi:hypothetical protein
VSEILTELDQIIGRRWKEFAGRSELAAILQSGALTDRRALAMHLVQAYHLTWHTSRNQGLVGVNPANVDLQYMRYSFRHALEEVGHEQMALHDLRALGLRVDDPERDLPPPLPATEQLLAWLYWVSTRGNPVARLGYSYWAERAYPYGGPYLRMVQEGMRLEPHQITFYSVHARIDERHGQEVGEAIASSCRTEADRDAVRRTLEVTMGLTFAQVLEEWAEYQRLLAGETTPYSPLWAIPR